MSVKIKTSWTDNNVIIEGVRIYKSSVNFDTSSRPAVYAEILDGSEFYEDFNVTDGQTYFYMLSCFLGEQEVFTECYEVLAQKLITYLPISFLGVKSLLYGEGTSVTAGMSFREFSESTSNQIIVVLAVSFVNVLTPAGWTKCSSLNNVHIFWKKGGNPSSLHNFILSSDSFLSLYAMSFNVAGTFNKVDVVAKNVAASVATNQTILTTPILDLAKNGPSYELSTIRLNQLGGGAITANWGDGLTAIQEGSGYQASLCVAGRERLKDSLVGGNSMTTGYWYMPNSANLQTIQICAYLD